MTDNVFLKRIPPRWVVAQPDSSPPRLVPAPFLHCIILHCIVLFSIIVPHYMAMEYGRYNIVLPHIKFRSIMIRGKSWVLEQSWNQATIHNFKVHFIIV